MGSIDEIRYKQLEDKDFDHVSIIIQQAFQKQFSATYLRKKYDASYLQLPHLATIAYHNHQPVAFYGAIPQLVRYKDQHILIVHTCDSFTIPSRQGKGLHRNLALKSYEIMQHHGVKLAYAFHSENTYHSTKKLNWKEHIAMKRFHVKTGSPPFAKVLNKFGLKPHLHRLDKVLKPFILSENPENPLLAENRACAIYSSAFFKYKESVARHYLVRIECCTFYIKADAIMHVGFFEYPDLPVLEKALIRLKKLAKRAGISEILFQTDPTTRPYKGLKAVLGSDLDSWRIGYLSFDDQIDIAQIGFNYADLDTF